MKMKMVNPSPTISELLMSPINGDSLVTVKDWDLNEVKCLSEIKIII